MLLLKKIFLPIILVISLLLLVTFVIQKISFNYIANFFYHENFYKLVKNYIPKVNHLRGLDFRICNNFEKPDCFIFTDINSNNKMQETILINGDSWAESFVLLDLENKIISNFAKKNNYRIILSGTSSYSFSPMTAQANILRKDWDIRPDYIISIFDQTDIGDELCRYKNYRSKNDRNEVYVNSFNNDNVNDPYNYDHFLKRNKIFYSDDLDFIKILKIAYLKLKHNNKKKDVKIKCNYNEIVKYLINGPDINQETYMINVINDYIKNIFEDKNLKNLFIITHPHKQHLENIYKYDISTLITKAIKISPHYDKIHTLNFKDYKILNYNDYLEDDVASHLKSSSLEKYTQHILKFFKKKMDKKKLN